MRPLQHKCPTLRGDKEEVEWRQTITCQRFHPNMGYLSHLVYAYITQGRPDRGPPRLTPRPQKIITQGIGVYATPLLQPRQKTTGTAQGNPVYIYHPTAVARLPVPSDTDIIYFTDAWGSQRLCLRAHHPACGRPLCGAPHMESLSSGRPPTANCAPWRTLPPPHHHPQQSGLATSGWS